MADRLGTIPRPGRLVVPRLADGPKVTLGILWVGSLLLAVQVAAPLAVLVLAPVAAVAGLQTGHAWARHEFCDRWATALGAGALAVSALFGVAALGAGLLAVTLGLVAYAILLPVPPGTHRIRLSEVLLLSAAPAGLAAGCLLALAVDLPSAFVSLVVLISAYETGDFLVGSGSANPIEGPAAGLTALGLVGVGLYLVLPEPFTTSNVPFFVVLAAIGAPSGQIAASAILPDGSQWAPALRRLDSYLLAAPIWLLLL